jgi:hypothetical protein
VLALVADMKGRGGDIGHGQITPRMKLSGSFFAAGSIFAMGLGESGG